MTDPHEVSLEARLRLVLDALEASKAGIQAVINQIAHEEKRDDPGAH